MAVSYVQVYWLLQFSLNLSSFHHFQETFSNIMNSEVNCRSESSSLDLEKSPKVCLFQFSTRRCFLFQFDCSNFINTVVHHRIYFMQCHVAETYRNKKEYADCNGNSTSVVDKLKRKFLESLWKVMVARRFFQQTKKTTLLSYCWPALIWECPSKLHFEFDKIARVAPSRSDPYTRFAPIRLIHFTT